MWLDKNLGKVNHEGKEVSMVQADGPGDNGENDITLCDKFVPKGCKLPNNKDLQQLQSYAGKKVKEQIAFLRLKNGFNCNDKFKANFRGYTQKHKKSC